MRWWGADSDDYLGVSQPRSERRYPLYTCLLYADAGGGHGEHRRLQTIFLAGPCLLLSGRWFRLWCWQAARRLCWTT
eukprot:COSAG04_NODE_27116_length_286_cov_1.112299_1_plen_76_part_10